MPDPGWFEGGWINGAERLDSPNCGPRPSEAQIDLIVIHSISLPPGEYGGSAVQQLFTNQLDWTAHPYYESIRGLQVSSHFFIGRTGSLWQFVGADMRAWHAGQSSFMGRQNCNDFSIGVELEGIEGQSFEDPQYECLAKLCMQLKLRYPIEHVAGHEHIAPGRKLDPGCGFDWPRLQQSVGWPHRCFPVMAA